MSAARISLAIVFAVLWASFWDREVYRNMSGDKGGRVRRLPGFALRCSMRVIQARVLAPFRIRTIRLGTFL
jgi:hypothetical protein